MSLSVNLSSPDIRTGYESVLDGSKDYLVLDYNKGTNDLKVSSINSTSSDPISEVSYELSDGRIQFCFLRVKDPNSQLPKFILLNWCGPGVPESRKGLFSSHSQTVAQFFKAAHLSVNARDEDDVQSEIIMKKVADSGGSKYSVAEKSTAGGAGATKRDLITPVGSAYKPVGTPDIKGLQAQAKEKDVIAPVVSIDSEVWHKTERKSIHSSSSLSGGVGRA